MKNLIIPSNLNSNLIKLVLILEWLGEKTCRSVGELDELRDCEEIKEILQVIKRENLVISDQDKTLLSIMFPYTMEYLDLID